MAFVMNAEEDQNDQRITNRFISLKNIFKSIKPGSTYKKSTIQLNGKNRSGMNGKILDTNFIIYLSKRMIELEKVI